VALACRLLGRTYCVLFYQPDPVVERDASRLYKKYFKITENRFTFAIVLKIKAMAITRLKRKEKRNKIVAKKRVANIKALTKVPVIRKVDIEELRKKAS
jgi:hypothetical protein